MKKRITTLLSALIIVAVFAQFSVAQSRDHDLSEKQKSERLEDDPESFRTNLTDVLEAYISGKDALLESNLDDARAEFESFPFELKSIGEHGLSGDGHIAWMESYSEMQVHTSAILTADDMDEAHSAFRQLPGELIKAVQKFGVDGVVYHQYCPMAIDSERANWLSKNEQVQNPYSPETMPGCGEVIERVESQLKPNPQTFKVSKKLWKSVNKPIEANIMKEIKAMIRPEMFETVYKNLRNEGYCCVTVYHGEGIGRHGDPDKLNASLEFPFLHSKITKLEILVPNEQEEEVINIIQQAACTSHKGDGIIYSSGIERAMSIRTGKEGAAVL